MRNFLMIFFLFLFVRNSAQERINAFGQFDIENFSVQQGLINPVIEHIEQDSKGYIWIATHGGLSRFDGKEFKNYTIKQGLPDNACLNVLEAPDGKIWVATHGGVACIDNEEIVSYTKKDGLYHSQSWRILFGKKGEAYIGTTDGINIIKDGKVKPFLQPKTIGAKSNVIRGMFFDSEENLWIGTNDELVKYSNGKMKIIQELLYQQDFLQDKNGVVWFCGFSNIHYIKEDKVLSIPMDTPVCGIELDKQGNIWGTTWNKGLIKYDGKKIVYFSIANGLSLESSWGLKIDREGIIWVGTFGAGLDRFRGERFVHFTKAEGLCSDVVNSIRFNKNGTFWVGTEEGVNYFDPFQNKFVSFNKNIGLPEDRLTGIALDAADNAYAIYYGGSVHQMDSIGKHVAYNIFGGHCIYVDEEGKIWRGTDGDGIYYYYNGKDSNFLFSKYLNENRINYFWFEKKDYCWVFPYSGGLQLLENGKFTYFNKKNGFIDLSLTGIIKDKNDQYWISAGDNLYVCEYKNKKIEIKDSISMESYFTNSFITTIAYNEFTHEIWVGTSNGVGRFLVKDYDRNKIIHPTVYGKEQGYIGGSCYDIQIRHDGKIWLGTNSGLWMLQEEFDYSVNFPPLIELTNIRLFWKDPNWNSLGMEKGNSGFPLELSLPYDQNNITFDFKALFLSAPDDVFYQYMLVGLDQDWSPETKLNEVTYSNLPPGEYVFRVKAKNVYGFWSEPLEYKFVIHPAFWQTWWFKISIIIFILISVVLFLRWRTSKLNYINKILEEKVAERTEKLQTAYVEIEEKNKDITDSLNYARKIQESILPDNKIFLENFSEYLLLFLPRDIVSGDFYFAEIEDDKIFVAVADCTGHGVPGAMVSMVCSNALKKVVKEFKLTDTGMILDKVAEIVETSFSVHNEQMRDGMDISLVCIDKKNQKISFSGANNPAWYFISNNGEPIVGVKELLKDMFEIPADSQPIGIYADRKSFKKTEWNYNSGDIIYLFSDGYADQFGGKGGKKYKYSRMKDFVASIKIEPLNTQKTELKNEFYSWKGPLEQLDDICVIGLKL